MSYHVLLLRHGQTDENARGVLQGQSDTRLNGAGLRQADALALRLGRFRPTVRALVTSDLTRAVQTMAPIERVLGLKARRDVSWRERGFGAFEGRTLGEADLWRVAAGTSELPGAEALTCFQERIHRALTALSHDHPSGSCIAVVTHGGPIRAVLRLARDGVLRLASVGAAVEVVPITNCSIVHLSATPDGDASRVWRIVSVNDVDHLGEHEPGQVVANEQ